MNIELLKTYIQNSTFNQDAVAEEIGMNNRTWYRRMKANNFTVNEFKAIVKVLNLSDYQIMKLLNF